LCAGLTEGLKDYIDTRWAIDNNVAAAETFQQNFATTSVICEDANAVLSTMMSGATLHNGKELPQPGEVDIIYSGPPCQAFSIINQHADSTNSQIKVIIHLYVIFILKFLNIS
jgi:site-specific DNA-cytosine methylase